jgi:hypothetical protein
MKSLTVIILMAMSSPFPAKNGNGKLELQILCRTFDNRYTISAIYFDSSKLKYYTDTFPKCFGDTIKFDTGDYTFIHKAGLDGLLEYEYEYDSDRYETLREILIEYPPVKPCNYYDPPSSVYRLGVKIKFDNYICERNVPTTYSPR